MNYHRPDIKAGVRTRTHTRGRMQASSVREDVLNVNCTVIDVTMSAMIFEFDLQLGD